MHVRDLADLAALVSVHGQQLVSASPQIVDLALESYWTASRCRLDRWCCSLRLFGEQQSRHRSGPWPLFATQVVEEVFVGEILTRCFAAILFAHDNQHGRVECDPIGRNIMGGHRDAARRALRLVANPANAEVRTAQSLEELHRRCQKWTDLLLAYVSLTTKVDEFAADPARVREFAVDASRHVGSPTSSHTAATMLSGGMRSTLDVLSAGDTPNADLNSQIATAVLACFGPEFFDSHGLLRSVWLERLQTVPEETAALLEQFWQPVESESPPPPEPKYPPFTARWQR